MVKRVKNWPEPRDTANAKLLTGYLAGAMEVAPGGSLYRITKLGDPLEVENIASGNRYQVTVRQISGTE